MPAWNLREIALREERRQAEGTAAVADESLVLGGGILSFAGRGSWANQACGLGLDGAVSDADLDRLVDFYASRGVEPRVELCPFADASVVDGLAERGFVLREFENVLARHLDPSEDLRSILTRPLPAELAIERVDPRDDVTVDTVIEVSTSGFRPAGEPVPQNLYEVARRGILQSGCDSYLARMDGVPAGGSSMEARGSIAALYGTTVLPRYRRRGIQAALIVRRLERARERGCTLAVIHSRPGIATESNALRLGFFLAYTKVVLVRPGEGLEPSP